MIFRVGLAVELMTQAAKALVQTVGIFETLANVKAWVKKSFHQACNLQEGFIL